MLKMIKYRKAYFDIEKALDNDSYGIVILLGLRKVGKTTILKQLAKNHNGLYLDFRNSTTTEKDYIAALQSEKKLLLLDEIGYLNNFDVYFESLEVDMKSSEKKVVITSSSYTALKQLSTEKLGGGRSYPVVLFPLSFEEYLYFSGRVSNYGEKYEPTEQDVEDFYRLKKVPAGMDFIIDKGYMVSMFLDAEVARANQQFAERGIFLREDQYASVLNILAYTLNRQFRIKAFGDTGIGVQEYGARKAASLELSTSLIFYANEKIKDIDVVDLAVIISHLYTNGYLFVDLKIDENNRETADCIVDELLAVKTKKNLIDIFKKYTFSVISPLLYTRLLVDIEDIVGKIYSNPVLKGRLYELAVKSEAVYKDGFRLLPQSKYFKDSITNKEIDLVTDTLLLEATIEHKSDENSITAHMIDKAFKQNYLIRVLADRSGIWEDCGNYYRIGYPQALFLLSENSIFDLQARRIV